MSNNKGNIKGTYRLWAVILGAILALNGAANIIGGQGFVWPLIKMCIGAALIWMYLKPRIGNGPEEGSSSGIKENDAEFVQYKAEEGESDSVWTEYRAGDAVQERECPNCGAGVRGSICEYCGTDIDKVTDDKDEQ